MKYIQGANLRQLAPQKGLSGKFWALFDGFDDDFIHAVEDWTV